MICQRVVVILSPSNSYFNAKFLAQIHQGCIDSNYNKNGKYDLEFIWQLPTIQRKSIEGIMNRDHKRKEIYFIIPVKRLVTNYLRLCQIDWSNNLCHAKCFSCTQMINRGEDNMFLQTFHILYIMPSVSSSNLQSSSTTTNVFNIIINIIIINVNIIINNKTSSLWAWGQLAFSLPTTS